MPAADPPANRAASPGGSLVLPTWVKHRDGRLAPFDSDVISRNLFAAARSLGPVDAFLVRELTDGILHFLSQEDLPEAAPGELIAEIIEKVLSQFGQRELAAAVGRQHGSRGEESLAVTVSFSPADNPSDVLRRCRTAYSLNAIYSPDVAAAHDQGLIRLGDLQTPTLLNAVAVRAVDDQNVEPFDAGWTLIADTAHSGRTIIVDGPEWSLRRVDDIAPFLKGIDRASFAYDRMVEVHLNAATSPSATRDAGPLFAGTSADSASPPVAWLDVIGGLSRRVRPVWRWSGDDGPLCRFLAHGRDIRIVFDRADEPLALAAGITRERPAILTTIEIALPDLLNRADVSCQWDVFLEKLPSLVRLAVNAGVQKRAFLRKHAHDLARGFLLDRAATRIIPQGLTAVLQQLVGVATPTTKPAERLVATLLDRLRQTFASESRRTSLEIVSFIAADIAIDNGLDSQPGWGGKSIAGHFDVDYRIAGLADTARIMQAVNGAAQAGVTGIDVCWDEKPDETAGKPWR
jgi:hypothetical protein